MSIHKGAAPTPPVVVVTREELVELIREAIAAEREANQDGPSLSAPSLLDVESLAAHLGVSRSTVHRLRRDGLPTIMVLESPRFDRDAVVAWLRAREGAA